MPEVAEAEGSARGGGLGLHAGNLVVGWSSGEVGLFPSAHLRLGPRNIAYLEGSFADHALGGMPQPVIQLGIGHEFGNGNSIFIGGAYTGAGALTSSYGEPNYPNGGANVVDSNSHQKHVNAATDCNNCHANTTVNGVTPNHMIESKESAIYVLREGWPPSPAPGGAARAGMSTANAARSNTNTVGPPFRS